MEKLRLMFYADAHGNELIFRKGITVHRDYKVDYTIIGGDLTGKVIAPIIKKADGTYECKFKGNVYRGYNQEDLENIADKLRNSAVYPAVLTMDEVRELQDNPQKMDNFFKDVTVKEMRHLVKILDNYSQRKEYILTPGNDDTPEIDNIIKEAEKVIYPLHTVIELPLGYQIISMDYSSPTPWNTPRECSDGELMKKLEKEAARVTGEWNKVICNFHDPPYGTNLDLAPKLDKDLKPIYHFGELEKIHVGSKSVLKFMSKYKPLLGLHGHIHESPAYDKVGETLVFNPGSEYQYGVFKAIIIEFTKEEIEKWYKIG